MKNLKLAQTISYFLSFIALGLAIAALGPTLPGLAAQTRVPLDQISFLFTVRSFGFLLGSLLSGRFFDRLNGHKVMAVMILLMSATLALQPIIPTLTILLGVMFVLGIAEGAVGVGGNALLVWVHQNRVPPYMNALHFFYGIGMVVSPLLIEWTLPENKSITIPYFTLAILVLPAALWLLRLPGPKNPQVAQDSSEPEPIQYKLVFLIALLLALDIGAEVGFGGWLYTYVLKMNLGGERIANNLTALFWGALTAGRLLGVPVAARLRPRSILLMDLLGSFISIGIALLYSTSLAALTVATVCLGISMATIYPTALTFAERRLKITGQGMSFFLVGGSVGGMIVPLLIGQLFDSRGPRVMLLTLLFDFLAAALVYLVLVLGFPAKAQIRPKQQPAV